MAEELGLEHQVCKSHVKRNTETFIENLEPKVESDEDGSLAAIGVTPEQALKDLSRLGELILSRQPEEENELEEMHHRYTDAAPPGRGEKARVAYRLRLMYLDRWNLWRSLTHYRQWKGPKGETVDGTNSGCERAIGWWVKERYRTMRGYKRRKSAVNVSRLLLGAAITSAKAEPTWLSSSPRTSKGGKSRNQGAYSCPLPNSERSLSRFVSSITIRQIIAFHSSSHTAHLPIVASPH